MTNQITLHAEKGRSPGSRESRRIRRAGGVPAIVYGKGMAAPTSVTVDHHDLLAALSGVAGFNALIELDIDGDRVLAIAHAVERHPYRHEIRHVDFHTVSMREKLTSHIAVHFEGEPAGAIEGGILTVENPTVFIESLPGEIPTAVVVDVSSWDVGHVMRISDLPSLPGVEYLDDPETVVASITRTAAQKAAEETAAAEVEAPGA